MSTGSMEQLYQQVILDHAKFPHGKGLGAAGDLHLHTGESHQVNPTCGDEVTLQVDLDAQGIVRDVRWDGQGCSISQASVSVLQTRGAGLDDDAEETLGDATAFTGVAKYPARIKCALLGWAALTDALIKTGARESS